MKNENDFTTMEDIFTSIIETIYDDNDFSDEIDLSLISEGIDVDEFSRTVFMTDKHEELINTSVANNPTVLTGYIPNVEVWSIFQRKSGGMNDGNLMLYALKNEKGYDLKNRKKIFGRIEHLVNNFFEQKSGIDVTIMCPSSNKLNTYFAKLASKKCKDPKLIDNLIVKMSIEEVDDYIFDKDSQFRKFYGRRFREAYSLLQKYYKSMKNGVFQFHHIIDKEMRKVIERTIKISDEYWGDYVDAINGKNILIIDDSITFGHTLKESIERITDVFTPKSITVLTLFSPLYTKTGEELIN